MKRVVPMLVLLVGCEEHLTFERSVPPACADKAAAFVVQCVSGASKLADVDQDYVVNNCKYTAAELFGTPHPRLSFGDGYRVCHSQHPLCAAALERWAADGEALCPKASP